MSAAVPGLALELREQDTVALLTLDVPRKRNAISVAMATALAGEVSRLDASPAVGAIVLTGNGPAFCAGMDLDDVGAGREIPLEFVDRVAAAETPVIAALNGAAATGGMELALACHFRIGCPETVLLDRHAQLGLFPRAGMSARLARLVGSPAALEISLTGRRVGAEEALRLRLIDRLVDSQRLLPEALGLAAAIAAVKPELRRRMTVLYREAAEGPLDDALAREREANRAWHEISGGRAAAQKRFSAARRADEARS